MDHAAFHFDIKAMTDAGRVEGLAAGYGNIDAHGDMFAPGAFAKSIASGRRPAMLLHHDPRRPAGRWESFKETPAGLEVVGHIATDANDGREAYALLKAGALTGLSVGFINAKASPGQHGGRLITQADLLEVSLVTTPSNPITQVTGIKAVSDVRELEEVLRVAGFSGRRAKAAAAAAWRVGNDTAEQAALDQLAAGLLVDATKSIRNLLGS